MQNGQATPPDDQALGAMRLGARERTGTTSKMNWQLKGTPVAAGVLASLLGSQPSAAQEEPRGSQQDVTLIVREQTTSSESGRSRSNSHTRGTLIERIVDRHADALELEYDLTSPSEERRGSDVWMFPVRVLKTPGEPPALLNEETLAVRLDAWLDEHPRLREHCGRHVFTWTAIQIVCDPPSALKAIAPYDLRLGTLEEGALYWEDGARSHTPLQLQSRSADGIVYVARLVLDPEALQEEDARMQMALAEMTVREPLSLEDALADLQGKTYDGTLTVTLRTDETGKVVHRKREVEITTTEPGGATETRSATDTVERQPDRAELH